MARKKFRLLRACFAVYKFEIGIFDTAGKHLCPDIVDSDLVLHHNVALRWAYIYR